MSLLSLTNITAGYGSAQVLFGIDLEIGEGEVVTLLGRNGMGKTTTVRAIMGLIKPWSGEVQVDGKNYAGQPPYAIGRAGVGLVPEGRLGRGVGQVHHDSLRPKSSRTSSATPDRLSSKVNPCS